MLSPSHIFFLANLKEIFWLQKLHQRLRVCVLKEKGCGLAI